MNNLDNVCRTITEDQWQHLRRKQRRTKYVTAIFIAVPMLFIVASTMLALRMWWIH